MRLTPEQARAAHAEGSAAVIAGAGTGKTAMLAARYLHHLTSHALSPLEVVAVTFTKKAAAELRARIRREASASLPERGDLLAELEAAQISTMHAMADRICREHPEAAGVPPDFAVQDELEGPLWMRERLAEALDALPPELYEQLPYSRVRESVEAFLHDPIAAERALGRGPESWPTLAGEARRNAVAELDSHPEWREAWEALQRVGGHEGDRMEEARRTALAAWAAWRQGTDPAAALEALGGIKLQGGSVKNWPDGGLDAVKAALARVRERANRALQEGRVTLRLGSADDCLAARLPALREAFRLCRERLAEAKRRARLLDFADLEVHALRALEDPDVQAYYRERWKAFLVDEFQDTNPVQAELLERLTRDALLTVVGDEKQSIYGFRGADVAVFRRFRQRIAMSGIEQPLSISFRTHAGLVTACNGVFAPVLGDLHQELQADRASPPHPGPHLRVYVMQAEKGTTKAQRQQAEAHHLALRLKEMLDARLTVHDKDADGLRPIRPGDIAVLARAWEPLTAYGEALEAAGIPTMHAGGGNLFATREAKDGWALLRFLADETDALALAAVLRSPFFAVSDPVLFTFARSLDRASWWDGMQQTALPELQRARGILSELRSAARVEPPGRLLQLADRLTGYTAVIANLPGAARREADWRGFLELVRALERGTSDVFVVARTLKRLLAADAQVPRPPLEAGDAVALMTIHGAKGLEWPVVVIPDLTRAAPSSGAQVCFDPELGVALPVETENGERCSPMLYTLIEHRRRAREAEEARRLLYVALTRARDHLILSATDDRGAGLDLLLPGLQATGLHPVPVLVQPDETHPRPLPDPELPPSPSRLLAGTMGSGLFELPATSLSEYARCPKRFRFRFLEGHPGMGNGDTNARRVGTLAHVALEREIQDMEELARFDPALATGEVEEALALARRFSASPAFAPVRGCDGPREQPVLLRLGRLTFHGVVDRIGPGFVLDYKTDREMVPEDHYLQLWVYTEGTGREAAHLAYLRHDTLHTLRAEELRAAGDEARAVAARISAGSYPARPSLRTCAGCPYAELCDDRYELSTRPEGAHDDTLIPVGTRMSR